MFNGEIGMFLVVFFGSFQAGVEGGESLSASQGGDFFFHSTVFVEINVGEVLGAGLDLGDEVRDAVLLPDAFLVLFGWVRRGREQGESGRRRVMLRVDR